jgi:hypothetical protein
VRTTLRRGLIAIATVACGLLVAVPANAKGTSKRSLRIVGTIIQQEFLDMGAPGPSLGDELVFSEKLSRRGRDVGVSGVVCVATQVTPPYDVTDFHCVGTLRLRRGQITLQGLIEVQGETDMGPFIVAITGGTGAYEGAGGTAIVRDVSETRSIYRLHLLLPKRHGH